MKNLKLYIAIAFGLIWAAGLVFYLSGTNAASFAGSTQLLAGICMFFPLVATLICQKSTKEPLLRNVGISWKVNRWWFIGWLIVPLIPLLTILFTYWTKGLVYGFAETAPISFMKNPIAMVAVTLISGLFSGVTINALFAFGEEIGWRGYLLKQFEGKNFFTSAIIIGVIWGLWHAPLILLGHNYPQHPQWGVLMMVVVCIPMSFIIQYFRVKSGSVIVAAIMHGTCNAVAGLTMLFVSLDKYNDLIDGATGLAGILAMMVVALCIFLFDRYVTRDRICSSPIAL
ncbi:MAG: CPBP family intramembrane metalloprotease, partial [Bacteroidales bacterium]|nr:CPBP family intramembrane metalloprotease [Bacteroidales bacterium]